MLVWTLVIINLLIVLGIGAILGTLRRQCARHEHDLQAVKQRLSEGGVELVAQVATEVKVPEPWRDLDGIPDEEVQSERSGLPGRLNGETWVDRP